MGANGTLAGIDEVGNLRRMHGDVVGSDDDGRQSVYADETLVSLNLWGLGPDWWPRLEAQFEMFRKTQATGDAEFRLPDAVAAEIATGAVVQVVETDARWVGVTHAADRNPVHGAVTQLFSEGHYPSPLYNEIGSPPYNEVGP